MKSAPYRPTNAVCRGLHQPARRGTSWANAAAAGEAEPEVEQAAPSPRDNHWERRSAEARIAPEVVVLTKSGNSPSLRWYQRRGATDALPSHRSSGRAAADLMATTIGFFSALLGRRQSFGVVKVRCCRRKSVCSSGPMDDVNEKQNSRVASLWCWRRIPQVSYDTSPQSPRQALDPTKSGLVDAEIAEFLFFVP